MEKFEIKKCEDGYFIEMTVKEKGFWGGIKEYKYRYNPDSFGAFNVLQYGEKLFSTVEEAEKAIRKYKGYPCAKVVKDY